MMTRQEKLLAAWTPEALARRIAEGEQLLADLRAEPRWMSELVNAELVRKRRLLRTLRAQSALAH